MIKQDILFLSNILRQKGRYFVTKQRLIVFPDLSLHFCVCILVEFTISYQYSQVLVINMSCVPQNGHYDRSQLFNSNQRETLLEHFVQLSVSVSPFLLSNLFDVRYQFVT
uniref:Uncharacterized protein n=1 Tax=Cacopsylla melanoneura TaxID=428564 RepID=A0A8D9BGC2_9HEMI